MQLLLLRHGKAEASHSAGDFSRALVERGRQQARNAAHFLRAAGQLPQLVLTSPLIRARQTADEFCQAAAIPPATVHGWLACGMTPPTAIRELAACQQFNSIALVGHEPDLSTLTEWLLGTTHGSIEVKKGTIVALQINPNTRYGVLSFLIPPALIDRPLTAR